LEIENNPEQPETGMRTIPFSRELYIEQDDFMENPPKKFFRLAVGQEVRLKSAYFIKCEQVIRDEQTGEVIELRCTYDPETKSGAGTTTRKVKGTLHWVSATHAVKAVVRLYDYLLSEEQDTEQVDKNFKDDINPNSMEKLTSCMVEPSLLNAVPENRYQFLRQGYFCLDAKDSTAEVPVFNRIVGLRDSWAKNQKA